MSFVKNIRHNESGTAAVEFALIGSMLIALTLGVYDLARYTYASHKLTSAMGVATRLIGMGVPDEEVINLVRARFWRSEQDALTINFAQPLTGELPHRLLVAQLNLPLILPNLGMLESVSEGKVAVRATQLIPLLN